MKNARHQLSGGANETDGRLGFDQWHLAKASVVHQWTTIHLDLLPGTKILIKGPVERHSTATQQRGATEWHSQQLGVDVRPRERAGPSQHAYG